LVALVTMVMLLGPSWLADAQPVPLQPAPSQPAPPQPNAVQTGPRLSKRQEGALDSLRRDVTDRLLASGKMSAVGPAGALTLKGKTLSGVEVRIELDDALAQIMAKPATRAEVASRLVRNALETFSRGERVQPPTRDQFIATLRLLVRHADHARSQPAATGGPALPAPLSRPLAGDAVVIVAQDRGESLVMVRPGEGALHGLDDAAVFDLARAGLQALHQDVTRETFGPLRYYAAHAGSFSPSLLLLDSMVEEMQRDLGPEFLVAIPDRTLLFAAPSAHAPDLRAAVARVSQMRKTAPHIPHLIQRKAGAWLPLPAP
jgi:hypothetical protein